MRVKIRVYQKIPDEVTMTVKNECHFKINNP